MLGSGRRGAGGPGPQFDALPCATVWSVALREVPLSAALPSDGPLRARAGCCRTRDTPSQAGRWQTAGGGVLRQSRMTRSSLARARSRWRSRDGSQLVGRRGLRCTTGTVGARCTNRAAGRGGDAPPGAACGDPFGSVGVPPARRE